MSALATSSSDTSMESEEWSTSAPSHEDGRDFIDLRFFQSFANATCKSACAVSLHSADSAFSAFLSDAGAAALSVCPTAFAPSSATPAASSTSLQGDARRAANGVDTILSTNCIRSTRGLYHGNLPKRQQKRTTPKAQTSCARGSHSSATPRSPRSSGDRNANVPWRCTFLPSCAKS